MKLSHTPGPWILDERHPGLVYCDDAAGSTVVNTDLHTVFITQEQKAANARLAAAAPDLLQALIRMLPYLHNFPEFQQIEVTSAILKAAPELKEHLQNYPLAA